MKVDKYSGAAEIALAGGMAARGNPPGQDLSSAVPLTGGEHANSERLPAFPKRCTEKPVGSF